MAKQLLTEFMPVTFFLEESEEGKLIARGEFAYCDRATANRRLYRRKLYEREAQRLSEDMNQRKVLGELDHPKDGRTSLKRVSHIITDLQIEDDGRVVGAAEILDTEDGRQLASLFRSGVKIGVSSRGFGSVIPNEKGEDVVQEDFKLLTFDFVADPANATSYPEVHRESREDTMSTKQTKAPAPQTAPSEKKPVSESEKVDNTEITALAESVSQLKQLIESSQETKQASLLEERDAEIKTLKESIEEQSAQMQQLQEDFDRLGEIARSSAYQYYAERRIGGHPKAELIRSMLGEASQYGSKEALDEAISEVLKYVSKEEEDRRKEEERRERELQIQEQERQSIEEQVSKYRKALDDLSEANNLLLVQLYANQRLENHPDRKRLMGLIESASPSSKEGVDRIIESENKSKPDTEQLASVRARVRAMTSGGLSPSALEEEKGTPKVNGESASSVEGLSLEQFNRMAGL